MSEKHTSVRGLDMAGLASEVLSAMDGRPCRAVAAEVGISPATLNRVTRGMVPDLLTYAALRSWLGTPEALRNEEGLGYAGLHKLQHDSRTLARPKLGGSIVQWAADEIAALRLALAPTSETAS
jgi:hypothetical protein